MNILLVTVSLTDLAELLEITERRVQQLTREGVLVRAKKGQYALALSLRSYCHYLGQPKKQPTFRATEKALINSLLKALEEECAC